MTRDKLQAAQKAMVSLKGFIGEHQLRVVRSALRGEEGEFFADKMIELAQTVANMPSTGQTEGQRGKAVAYLHYFAGGQANFYITEKDKGAPDDTPEMFQSQAFGLADLFQDGGELGYISIPEILSCRGELDFYWTPKTLDEIRKGKRTATAMAGELVNEMGLDGDEREAVFNEMLGR